MSLSKSTEPKKQGKNKQTAQKPPNPKSPAKKDSIKLKINNQIIQYQGKFKQAKINTINKIVHKLKQPEKLQKKSNNPEAKLERYQNVLNCLKHISPKRLGLLALHSYKSGQNHLANPESTIEQLAVAYFCESKNLNTIFDSIRTKLNLDANNKWKRATRKLFKKKETKEIIKKERTAEDDSTFNETNVKNPKQKVKKNKSKKESNDMDQSQESGRKNKKAKRDESLVDEEDNELNSAEPSTVDEFFFTADGTNYLSNAVVNENQKDDDGDDDTEKPRKQFHDFGQKAGASKGLNRNDGTGRFDPNKSGKRFVGEKRKWTEETNDEPAAKEEKKIDPNLHPSWIAKQKQKPTIAAFKGSKITFD